MLDILHKDITYKILTDYLDIKDVVFFISCNKQTLELLKDEKLWKSLTTGIYIHFEHDNKIKWFDLYKILYKNDLFIKSRAKLYNINHYLFDKELFKGYRRTKIDDEEDVLDLLNAIILEKDEKNDIYVIIKNMKKGDIVKVTYNRMSFSPTNTIYIHNGKELEMVFEEEDMDNDYPCIEEFPINYWDDIFNGLTLICFNNIYINEIKKNIHKDKIENVIRSYFIHNYAKYYIIFEIDLHHNITDPEDYDHILKLCIYSTKPLINIEYNKYIINNRTIIASFTDEYLYGLYGNITDSGLVDESTLDQKIPINYESDNDNESDYNYD
jgi:hypothetical protein